MKIQNDNNMLLIHQVFFSNTLVICLQRCLANDNSHGENLLPKRGRMNENALNITMVLFAADRLLLMTGLEFYY